jgi:homoserine dehydrogenase
VSEAALRQGKHVVTANKALVAEAGPFLERLAQQEGVAFRYEAAAAGAVPIVAHLRLGLSPGPVRGFDGVLNGTSNFVLSRLSAGVGFGKALREARERGFAEADPSRDTSGRDAADKLVILARLLGFRIDPDAVSTVPIDGLTPADARFGAGKGWALKQVATFRLEDGAALAAVGPCFVPASSPLSRVDGAENVIVLEAGGVGRLCLSGPGAGGAPTAAAILSDVREILRSETHASPAPPRRIPVWPGRTWPGRRYVRRPGRPSVLTRSSRLSPGSVSIAVLENH